MLNVLLNLLLRKAERDVLRALAGPVTLHFSLAQLLPPNPRDAVGSMTMSSQLPIALAVDSDTTGYIGLTGAVAFTEVALAYGHTMS